MDFLNILAIFAPSIAAIYIIDFFVIKKQRYVLGEEVEWGVPALLSWVISSGVAALTYFEVFRLSGAYYVDAFLIGLAMYLLFCKNCGSKR